MAASRGGVLPATAQSMGRCAREQARRKRVTCGPRPLRPHPCMWVLACMLRPRHACDASKHAGTAKGAAGRAVARRRRGQSKYRGVTRHHQQGRWEARPPAAPFPAHARPHAAACACERTRIRVCDCPVGILNIMS